MEKETPMKCSQNVCKKSDACLKKYHLDFPEKVIHVREKGRVLTQSYDKSLYTDRKIKKKKKCDNTKTPPKTSITQRLRTDLGWSVWVTIATQLVLLYRFTGSQPSHLPPKPCNQDHLIKKYSPFQRFLHTRKQHMK